MTLSDLAIKKPVFAWMIMISLLLFGAIGFQRLGVSQNPDVDSPIVNISVTWEGAAPEVIENEVVDPIEQAVMTVEGIKTVRSTARFGSANITAEFVIDKDIDVSVQEVQTRIAQAQRNLPTDMDPPIIRKVNPEDTPIITVGISGTRPYPEIASYVQDHLVDHFQTLPGVGEVSLAGFIDPNLRVWLNPKKMHNLQITVEDVMAAISAQHAELPGGVLETSQEERSVRVLGEASSTEEFGNLTIPTRVGGGVVWRTIRLKDIARIEEGLADVRRMARVNGERSIGLGIQKQRGSNAVDLAHHVKEMIEKVRKDLPSGMTIGVNSDSTRFIEDNIHELLLTLVLAVLFTSVVCWLFLGSLSSTLNVILAIPTALGGTMMVMYFLGFTLNTITLMAISLVIGIVVDDAIVILENIVRHREAGQSQIQAAVYGAREVMFSVIVISSAVIAIFLPVAFMEGVIGKFFFQFGVTLSIAVAFSLMEAITLAPMRCSQFLEVGNPGWVGRKMNRVNDWLLEVYRRSLAVALNHRLLVIGSAIVLFALSLLIVGRLRREMTPPYDQGGFVIRLQTQPSSSLAYTDEAFKKAEAVLAQRPEVQRYFGNVGGGGGQVNTGTIIVTMKEFRERPQSKKTRKPVSQEELQGILRKEFKNIQEFRRISFQELAPMIRTGSGRSYPIDLSIHGPDWDKLGEYAETIRTKLLETGLAVDVDTNYLVGTPEVRIVPDREKAAERGVTVASIGRTISSAVGGVRAGKYTKGGRRYDIRVSLSDEDRKDVNDISGLWVRNVRGELIPLSAVTAVLEKPTILSIQREDRERSVSVYGNVVAGKSQAAALDAAFRVAKDVLPDGYRAVAGGNSQQFGDTFKGLGFALILGVAIAYMILGAQFNSFIHPLTILLALPFSISGALGALWIADHSLNMMSMIGILLLMGIVKKNSILLVEFTNHRREAGLNVRDALLEACPTRLRPILMTSLAIIAGALPAALTLGPGAELRAPMGTSVIGGTLLSTLLTLYVVPCAYSLFERFESKGKMSRLQEVETAINTPENEITPTKEHH